MPRDQVRAYVPRLSRTMNHISSRSKRAPVRIAALTALCIALISGCGGGGAETTSTDSPALRKLTFVEEREDLGKFEPVVVRFDAPVNPGSLRITGSLASQGVGAWSKTQLENDTYTLSPPSAGWLSGPNDLSISATGVGGGSVLGKAAYLIQLVFDPASTAAVVAIGQENLTTREPDRLTDANTLSNPVGGAAATPDGTIYVPDYENGRVLGYRGVPSTSNASASIVLGKPNFRFSGAGSPTATNMGGPQQISIAAGKMAVVDTYFNRVLIYNSVPTSSGVAPDVVVGQRDFFSANQACGMPSLSSPASAQITPDGKLVVADQGNNRVLIWDRLPTVSGQPPSIVLGQSDAQHCRDNDDDQDGVTDEKPSARTLSTPSGVWSDGQRLAVIDTTNHRVLIWSKFPTKSFAEADIVLGQASFDRGERNDDKQVGVVGSPSARTLNYPYAGIASNGMQLAVADEQNNRVLIWNKFPTGNFAPADVVIGQGRFQTGAENDSNGDGVADQVTARTLYFPNGVLFYQDSVIVTDGGNTRVLVYRSK